MTPLTKTIYIIIAVLLVGWLLVWLFSGESKIELEETEQTEQTAELEQFIMLQRKSDGTSHSVQGLIETPTPCHKVAAETSTTGANEVTLSITTSRDDDEVCTQIVTGQIFSLDYEAPADAQLKGLLNGKPVTLNIIDLSADEEFQTFDAFTKG